MKELRKEGWNEVKDEETQNTKKRRKEMERDEEGKRAD